MYSTIAVIFSGLALARAQSPPVPGTTGQLGDAAVVTDNPIGVTYTAVLPDSNTTDIRGYIAATTSANGTGLSFNVNFYGFPSAALGPFAYHVHDQPVPASGNCTATLAHQDPYIRGEIPPCDKAQPETCQTGDLSGKFGNITSSPFQASYFDFYSSTKEGIGAFIGNRSIVIHTSNTSRLTCANFVLTPGSASNVSNTTTTGASPTPSPFTGGAVINFAGATAIVGVVVAGLAFFL